MTTSDEQEHGVVTCLECIANAEAPDKVFGLLAIDISGPSRDLRQGSSPAGPRHAPVVAQWTTNRGWWKCEVTRR